MLLDTQRSVMTDFLLVKILQVIRANIGKVRVQIASDTWIKVYFFLFSYWWILRLFPMFCCRHNTSVWIFIHLPEFLLPLYVGVEWLSLRLCASSATRYWQIALHLSCVQFLVPPAVHKSFYLSTRSTNLVLSNSSIFANLVCTKWYFTVVSTDISLVDSEVDIFSYVYWPYLLSLLWNDCSCLFAHFSVRLFGFFLLIYRSFFIYAA